MQQRRTSVQNRLHVLRVFDGPLRFGGGRGNGGNPPSVLPFGSRVAFSPRGDQIAWIHGPRLVILLQIETGSGSLEVSRELLIQTDLAVVSLNFGLGCPGSPFITGHWRYGDREETNGVMLATGHNDGAIRIWHSISGRLLLKLADHTGPVTEVAFAPDQSMRLVSASKDKTLKVWDLTDDGNMFKTLRGHVNGVTMCAWCPSGRLMASVGSGKKVIMWDMEEYGMRWNSAAHHNQIKSCQFSPDGAFLLTASYDTRVLVLDTATGQLLRTLFHVWPMPSLIYASGSNSCWIRSVTISPEGTGIVTVADDGLVRLWDLGDETSPAAVFPVEAQMSCCRYSPKQNLLAVVTTCGKLLLLEASPSVPTLKHLARLAVRRRFSTDDIPCLNIPATLADFLLYHEWL